MTQAVINPRIRGFICLTAHPEGCAANVRRQVELAREAAYANAGFNTLLGTPFWLRQGEPVDLGPVIVSQAGLTELPVPAARNRER